jgi:sporulation protein YunB
MQRQMRLSPVQRSRRRRVKIVVFMLIIAIILVLGQKRLTSITVQMAETKATNIAESLINDAIEEELQRGQINYDDLISLEKGDQGQITALKSNIVESNRIKAQITQNIVKRLGSIPQSQLAIPIGNLVNSSFFTNMGPKIPIKLTPIGSVSANYRHSFSSAGINQTRHQIVFEASVTITIFAPGRSVTSRAMGEMTIAETIIVGSVPGSYTFFDTGGLGSESGEGAD